LLRGKLWNFTFNQSQESVSRVSTEASSASRRMFKRLPQVPLLRAVAQPSRSFEIIV
jgi:hypothetical protein